MLSFAEFEKISSKHFSSSTAGKVLEQTKFQSCFSIYQTVVPILVLEYVDITVYVSFQFFLKAYLTDSQIAASNRCICVNMQNSIERA